MLPPFDPTPLLPDFAKGQEGEVDGGALGNLIGDLEGVLVGELETGKAIGDLVGNLVGNLEGNLVGDPEIGETILGGAMGDLDTVGLADSTNVTLLMSLLALIFPTVNSPNCS